MDAVRELHSGDVGEAQVLRGDRGAVLDARVLARRRRPAFAGPAVHGEEEGALSPAEVVGVGALLSDRHARGESRGAVLGAGVHIDADVVRDPGVLAGVNGGVDQARGAAPVFVRGVRVEDPRIERLALASQQPQGEPRLRIGLLHIGEGEDVRRVELVHVGVGVARGLREAVVEAAAAAAGHVGDHPVEHPAALFVAVEPVEHEGPQEAAALGDPEADGAGDVAGGDPEFLGAVMAEQGHEVADAGRPEAHQRRVVGPVHHLVDPVRLEPAVQVHRAVVGDHRAVLDPAEAPLVARDDFPLVLDPVAHGQHVDGVVRVLDPVGPVVAVGERVVIGSAADHEVGPHQPLDGGAVRVGRDRRVHPHAERVVVGDVPLPAQPEEREPVPHQEPVAEVRLGRGGEAPLGHVEVAEHPLAPAVVDLVQQGAPALFHDLGADQVEVGGHLHLPVGVPRCEGDVGDDPVGVVFGIESEVDDPDDLLVGAGQAEALASEHVGAFADLEPDDLAGGGNRECGQQAKGRDNGAHVSSGHSRILPKDWLPKIPQPPGHGLLRLRGNAPAKPGAAVARRRRAVSTGTPWNRRCGSDAVRT